MRGLVATCCLLFALEASATSLERLFMRGTRLDSNVLRLTLRGILPFPDEFVAHPRFEADGWRVLLERDVKLWYMPVYVMPNLEVAFEHQQRVPYPLTQGLYLINSQFAEDTDLREVDFDSLIQMPQTRKALYESGEWHDDESTAVMHPDRWRFVSREGFELYLPSNTNRTNFPVQAVPPSPHFGDAPHYRVPAFAQLKVLGINHADTLQDRNLRTVFNKTRTLFKQGYRVTFNTDVEFALSTLQNQERRHQSLAMNRHRSPIVANTFRAAFAASKAFTALLRAPEGQTVAGVVGYTHGNVYRPDSVFYHNIDEAKVVYLAMLRYLGAHGINFTNAGMVTPFTASIGGYRLTEQQYRDLVVQLPTTPVSLPVNGWQDAITIVVPTAKLNQQHLEHLVVQGKVSTPLLLLNSSSGERPAQQSAKNNKRTASMERLLTDIDSFIVYEPNLPPWEASGGLPERWLRYFDTMHRIEVVPVEGINLLQVSTLSGFPASLLADE